MAAGAVLRSRSALSGANQTTLESNPLSPVPSVPPRPRRCRAVRTARSWRGIVASTHLAREGRMTVTIGRRELLAALGGAAAWPRRENVDKLGARSGFGGLWVRAAPPGR